jgi:EAL domain-containing protein (putative c-di-GMP-specific phosphodiesterase class I)/GGDEF domain-containing protein
MTDAISIKGDVRPSALTHAQTDALPGMTKLRDVVTRSSSGYLFMIAPDYGSPFDVLEEEIFDRVERTLIGRLRHLVGATSTIYRGTRSTLFVISAGEDEMKAMNAARAFVEIGNRPMLLGGHSLYTKTFVGIAPIASSSQADAIFAQARLALRDARKNSSESVSLFTTDMLVQAERRRSLEMKLRRAVALNEFTLVYQPQFQIQGNKLVGFEALVRWVDEDGCPISPADFIPVAEEIGLIDAIGTSVLHSACRDAARWPGHLTVSVNVSPSQLLQSGFEETVLSALRLAELEPARLELEVTEGVLLPHEPDLVALIERLRQRGIRFALDDFGTGYSSLAYLQHFAFDKLKIDQAFVRTEPTKANQGILRAAVGIASALDITTIAEGVETQNQLDLVRLAGCDYVQGYLTGRPMAPADAFNFANIQVSL